MNQEMIVPVISKNPMLSRLGICNFHGLKELSLASAARVNLIVGRNDSGKTSLLEAIRILLTGDPRHLRRPRRNPFERKSLDLEQAYRLAFHQAYSGDPIQITGNVGESVLSAKANIIKVFDEEILPPDPDSDEDPSEATESLLQPGHEIVVEIRADNGAVATIKQLLRDKMVGRSQRHFSGGTFPDIPPLVWLGTNRAEVWSHARRYSDLYRTGGSPLLLDLLKDIEPRLQGLVVLTDRSETGLSNAVLEVDLGLGNTLPLESMGDGFSSTIALLSAIGASKGGLCLIDEVENGIHYSLLTQIWRSVSEAAIRYNAQIWATTHSYDCIAGAYEGFRDAPEALRVHRLERRDDGSTAVHSFDHAMLGRALERSLEVR